MLQKKVGKSRYFASIRSKFEKSNSLQYWYIFLRRRSPLLWKTFFARNEGICIEYIFNNSNTLIKKFIKNFVLYIYKFKLMKLTILTEYFHYRIIHFDIFQKIIALNYLIRFMRKLEYISGLSLVALSTLKISCFEYM